MSLLLDALKKAAKDKEARSASAAGVPELLSESAPEPDVQSLADSQTDDTELTLEDIPATQLKQQPDSVSEDESIPDEQPLAIEGGQDHAPGQMSDEALQVLIYKTNHAHRSKRRLIWGSATIISVTVLIFSGLYFFKEIQHGISMLELRHRVNMRVIASEPVKIKNLQMLASNNATSTSKNSDTATKVNNEKASHAHSNVRHVNKVAPRKSHVVKHRRQYEQNAITVAHSQKADPVDTLLTEAWNAYNAANYKQASKLYRQVLADEKNNRDALMGMGAIALKQNNRDQALDYYSKMLQLDPRDPVANAAILNMNQNSGEDEQSENRLLYLIKLEPDAAHLYNALGNKYAEQSKWPEAESAYFSAFEYDNNSADYAYNLAVSLERIGRPKEAVQYYRAALRLAKDTNVGFSIDVVKKRLSQIQP